MEKNWLPDQNNFSIRFKKAKVKICLNASSLSGPKVTTDLHLATLQLFHYSLLNQKDYYQETTNKLCFGTQTGELLSVPCSFVEGQRPIGRAQGVKQLPIN